MPQSNWSENDPFELDRWATDGGPVSDEDDRDPAPVAVLVDGLFPAALSRPVGNGTVFSLNRKAAVVGKPVYRTLADHQRAETDWDYHTLSVTLGEWYGRFNDRLGQNLPQVPLWLDPRIRRNCAGYFLPDHNEFGLAYEIAVAVPPPAELARVDLGEILGTLLHEQLHLLQELTGVPGRNNYHNAAYRRAAAGYGLLVDHRGHQTYAPESVFLDLLHEYGVEPPWAARHAQAVILGQTPPAPPAPRRSPGRSKLSKWTCGCTNVRVGVSELSARCTRPDCGRPFVRV